MCSCKVLRNRLPLACRFVHNVTGVFSRHAFDICEEQRGLWSILAASADASIFPDAESGYLLSFEKNRHLVNLRKTGPGAICSVRDVFLSLTYRNIVRWDIHYEQVYFIKNLSNPLYTNSM
jgi:hypothetical protein